MHVLGVASRPSRSLSGRWLGRLLGVLCLASVLSASGCAEINRVMNNLGVGGAAGAVKAINPTVTASPVQLSRYPSMRLLASYYCPIVITDTAARLGCSIILGAPPPREQLVFEFGTNITIQNPNNFPVPALDVLLSMKLFQGQGAESLGGVCLSLCGSNEPSCNGQPKPGACTANGPNIRTMRDVISAVPGLIMGLASGAVQNELRKNSIAARGNVQLTLTFAMGIDQTLRVIQRVMPSLVQSMLGKKQVTLEIPVSAEGTVFVQLPGLGRVGVGFGPFGTVWRVI